MKPSIDVAIKLAEALETTVSYLVGESSETTILTDPLMMKRINDINSFEKDEQGYVLFSLDASIQYIKVKRMMKKN